LRQTKAKIWEKKRD